MNGVAARLTKILVLAGLGLALLASSGAAASPTHTRILGVVAHTSRPAQAARRPATAAVAGSSSGFLGFDSNYESVINRYFADVAHDSGGNANVYSVATQYSDGSGPIQYQSTFGGSYVDHDPLPKSGCNDGQDSACLTDGQVQAEIQRVLTANGWHGGTGNIFFVMTPDGVGSCADRYSVQCASNYYCAYHGDFTDSSSEPVIYAVEPYQATIPGCSSGSSPNGDDADTTLNTISHEHNEAITDPFADAWWANDGAEDENGDLCAWTFGTPLGGAGTTTYNQLINGHPYWLQQEYSNAGGGCVQNLGGPSTPPGVGSGPLAYHGGQVMHTNTTYAIYWLPTPRNNTRPTVSGTAAVKQHLRSSSGSWNGSPVRFAYQWQRCSRGNPGCVDIPGATGSTYTLKKADAGKYVRSTVRAQNVNGASVSVTSAGRFVVSLPHSEKAPSISGQTRVGHRLSESRGSWSGPPRTFGFQWLRCNAQGARCAAIADAAHTSYKLTQQDAGHRLRVQVTAVNAAGRKTATSSATLRVSAAQH